MPALGINMPFMGTYADALFTKTQQRVLAVLGHAARARHRSENRYLVFQCLEHTLGWKPVQWLLLD